MTEKKKLSAREIVERIRAGATDADLMRTYGLSEERLQALFKKLVEIRALTQQELDQRNRPSGAEHKAVHNDKESAQDILKGIAQRFNIPKEDLERLKTASIRDVKEFLRKHNIPLSDAKDLVKVLGFRAGDLVSDTTEKLKGKAQELMEKTRAGGKGKEPWYENPLIVILLVTCFFPVGLYGLWKSSRFQPITKKIVTGVVAVMILIAIILMPDNKATDLVTDDPVKQSYQIVLEWLDTIEKEYKKNGKHTKRCVAATNDADRRIKRLLPDASERERTEFLPTKVIRHLELCYRGDGSYPAHMREFHCTEIERVRMELLTKAGEISTSEGTSAMEGEKAEPAPVTTSQEVQTIPLHMNEDRLVVDYENNADTADLRYRNKRFKVNMTIYDETQVRRGNYPSIMYYFHSKPMLQAILRSDQEEQVTGLSRGNCVTLEGVCVGKRNGVVTLVECIVIDITRALDDEDLKLIDQATGKNR